MISKLGYQHLANELSLVVRKYNIHQNVKFYYDNFDYAQNKPPKFIPTWHCYLSLNSTLPATFIQSYLN